MNDQTRLLAGRYEMGELIGRGGMADVHLGYDTRLGREVAIKILRSELARDRSFLMRFRREAQSAASLNHPNIVAVFDSGEESVSDFGGAPVSVPFIVMEYVRGRTLRDVLAEDGPFDPFEAGRVMAQVLRALDYSHDHGIIHRDIKPANVMMGQNGQPKVMDFGIARAIADTAATMTNTSVVVGTAQYLSPEQAQGQEVDARSDLYSAGCLLYELITGRPPFVGDSPVAIAYQHVGEPPQPPSVHAAAIPISLDVVALHALAKDPAARYQSGGAFADDLDAVITGGPTLAAREAVADGRLAGRSEPWDPQATGSTAVVVDPAAAPVEESAAVEEIVEEEPSGRRRPPLWAIVTATLGVLALVLGLLWSQGVFDREPAPVAVPAVVGETQKKATAALQQAGFTVQSQSVRNKAKAGLVVEQRPGAQSMQPPGSTVTLHVSSGPGAVTVPNLANYDPQSAFTKLTGLGLAPGDIVTVDSASVDQGKVVSTDPEAGKKVTLGSAVALKVSSGKITMPGIVGMSRSNAIEKLARAGLRGEPVQVQSTRRTGTVVSQAYPKGMKVPVGSVVQISVAAPMPRPSASTTTVTATPDEPRPTRSTEEPKPSDTATTTDEETPADPETTTPSGEEVSPQGG
ncbi:Stk1 family PASTA domain-containing Ser/Thr kinase [Mobilicoccus pelagius]|uniref:non-specific serine/threonine protein kinase n=1 Tax=Mobilicoccus pelagius NBRC 104925 TaxID=1089455 RepID=H5USU4_9MICO|nr:Stk1 family PASTA domain-containing Ser/Thr kinase [Mobilicoccus pelagius]GAB48802.1 serine/threonine protein kinase PknB [Mobilicoccus pelagius NBRC 104925]